MNVMTKDDLIPSASETASPVGVTRMFLLDARFAAGGVWAGVSELAMSAYQELVELRQTDTIARHLHELYMVLPEHRSELRPKYLCLTDTVADGEKTRFYALDRAYRQVHGLVGLILQWKAAQSDRGLWRIVVRHADQAQHLATRFFRELARRAAPIGEIEVSFEAGSVPPNPDIANAESPDPHTIARLELQIADADPAPFERNFPSLLAHYKATGDHQALAHTAFRALSLYKQYGYHHEAAHFVDRILPRLDAIAGRDEDKRLHYISEINDCLVMTGASARAMNIISSFAVPHLTEPSLLAKLNYMIAMHHLRYADVLSVERAEHHIELALADIGRATSSADHAFLRVFIDNGLAFLRVRQGRHAEALALCQDGYARLTEELGEERHQLHRSVLQYNLGQVCVAIGHFDDALRYYDKAISMDPYYTEYHTERGNILQKLLRFPEAIASYDRAIACSAPYPEVLYNKALCHTRLGEREAALACFDSACELDPDQPQIYALRADLLAELGRDDDAIDQYTLAIANGFDQAAAWVNRAVLHFSRGNYAQALDDMNSAIAREPDQPAHYRNREAIYQAMEPKTKVS
jgi:tetratricopeptide (TPR) repeat protein